MQDILVWSSRKTAEYLALAKLIGFIGPAISVGVKKGIIQSDNQVNIQVPACFMTEDRLHIDAQRFPGVVDLVFKCPRCWRQ